MASDEVCFREGKVLAYEVGVGPQAVERDRLKADFVKMLRQHPNGLPIALFKDAYEEFFHRPLVLVRTITSFPPSFLAIVHHSRAKPSRTLPGELSRKRRSHLDQGAG